MARANAHNTVLNLRGEPIAGAEVRVYENRDTGSPIAQTMYDAPSGGNVLAWPLTTNTNGLWSFYVATPQMVTLVVSYPGADPVTVHDVHVAAPSNEAATDSEVTAAVAGLVSSSTLTSTLASYLTTVAAAAAYIAKSLVTTAGDLIYRDGSGPTRLAIGTAHQELAVNAGATAPTWASGARAVVTTAGDLIYATAANTLARLGLGTKGQALLAGASAPTWGDMPRKNLLINGSGQVNQRVTAASTDNGYGPDLWRLLLEASTAGTLGQTTSNLPSTGSAQTGLVLTIGSSNNNKVGTVQMIRHATCGDLRGGVVSLQFKGKVNNARIGDVRAAVIEFTGTADNGGSAWASPISSWGAAGTNPTLATNYAYCNTPANLNPSTSDQTFKIEGISVSSSMKNLGLLLWIDDKTTTAADWLTVTDIQVEAGAICTAVDRPNVEDVIAECEHYYQKSIALTATPLSSAQGEAFPTYAGTVADQVVYSKVEFATRMYGTPTVRIWPWTTPSNTSRVSNSGGTDLAAGSGTPYVPTSRGFAVQNASGGTITTGSNLVNFAWDAVAPW